MCDIFTAKCEGCGSPLDVHIGDFSCPRDAVTVWCPSCAKKAEPPTPDARRFEEPAEWDRRFNMWVGADNHSGKPSKMRAVLFCTDPKGRSIHLN